MNIEGFQVEAGVDWLSTTFPADGPGLPAGELRRTIEAMYGAAVGPRIFEATWASLGYIGYREGKCKWGHREDGSILIVSGGDAHHYVELGGPIGQNVSRLDLQCTFLADEDATLYITELAQIALEARKELGGNYKISHIQGCGDGDTLYLGARSSDVFFRIYDKGKESGAAGYKGFVRFEVEFKGSRAIAALGRLRGKRSLPHACVCTLASSFRSRGVYFPFDVGAVGPLVRCPDRARSSDEDSLTWLATQVRPTVRRLLSTHDRATIETALGMSANVDEGTQKLL